MRKGIVTENLMRSDVIPSVVWVILGITMCIASASLHLGSWRRPGPGLYPFLIGGSILLLSASQIIVQIVRRTGKREKSEILSCSGGVRRIFILSGILIFFTFALKPLGFLLCTFVFFVALFKTLGEKSWKNAVLTGFIVSILSHVIFQVWLRINLPPGFLGQYLVF